MKISSQFQEGKYLSEFSTFGIGGPVRFFLEVRSIEGMQEVLRYCLEEKLPYCIIGKGSNSLFDDRGFSGLAILNKIAFCMIEEQNVHVGAGYSFSLLGVQTARKGLGGLEFASGIPASVGGAVFMNAGANGGETKDALTEVSYVSPAGELQSYKKEELSFGYRTSSFQQMKGAIVSAKFHLISQKEARERQLKIIDYRTRTQPYNDKSIGCVFRNPPAQSAGALIEQSGLKGVSIGGAEVSTLHANFIINRNNATAQNVLALAKHVQHTVKEKTGVELEMEMRIISHESPHVSS